MDGKLDGFEPCHRIAAARELAKRGDKRAIAFLQSFYPKPNGRKSNGRKPSPAIGEYLPDDELAPNYELAEIVREVTGNGRTIVCFLHDAMQGIFDGFKPCHRVACGKELLRRGFDIIPADYYDEYEDHDDVQQCHDEPFDHKKYAREQFWRDGADGEALAQIYGSEEAVSVALSAVRDHRRKTVLADATFPTATTHLSKTLGTIHTAKVASGTTPCASHSTTTSPSGPPTKQSRNSRSKRPNTPL